MLQIKYKNFLKKRLQHFTELEKTNDDYRIQTSISQLTFLIEYSERKQMEKYYEIEKKWDEQPKQGKLVLDNKKMI